MQASKVAIFGYSEPGVEVAKQLANIACDFIIVDNDADNLLRARTSGFTTAQVDYTNDSELEKIGIGENISAIFCLFADDSDNVFLTISARALAPHLQIFAIAESPDSAWKLRAAGADKIVEPYEVIGHRISHLIHNPLISDILEKILFGQADLNHAEIEVPADSFLVHQRLPDAHIREHYNLIVLGIGDKKRNKEFLFAMEASDHRLEPGDILVVIGPINEITNFERAIATRS